MKTDAENFGKTASKLRPPVRHEINARLLEAAHGSAEDVLKKYGSPAGLTPEQLEESLEKYGRNIITRQKKRGWLKLAFDAFASPFTAILIVLAAVSFVMDYRLADEADKSISAPAIILAMVILSGLIKFFQEKRSGKAAEQLQAMVRTTASVERQGTDRQEIPLDGVAVGDIIDLTAGDMLPADVRILRAKDLFVSQAALTGESEPMEKIAAPCPDAASVQDSHNLSLMGSNVISGSAQAVVLAVGDQTLLGGITKKLAAPPAAGSFEKGVNAVSWVLIRFMLVMVPFVLVVNGLTKGDWVSAFLFALSVAVGLTPEMLPMIVTTCLAKGAVTMSGKKTIVKNINSMQNFGAMDVLCTDKTGTLTQDEVALMLHMDVHGREDPRVLRHAFLNSQFQTGLRNLMDIAVIRRTREELGEEKVSQLTASCEKVDEIPFDFNRRRMSVVVRDRLGKTQMITKGAVEEILSVCVCAEYQGRLEPITDSLRAEILDTVSRFNSDGMRVIAVAQKNGPSPVGAFSVADESGMTLIGYLAFLDPPKITVRRAIASLSEHGVSTKVLTGDNEKVTRCICRQVGLRIDNLLLGSDIEAMDDSALAKAAESANVFAKLSPDQKNRIVQTLRNSGHVVGFMGDGINDAAAMKTADVGISVDTAVDIAKESADIILLEKDLMVLEDGIVEGRKVYANMIKYIKMTASSNFGNMFSVLIASAFLPFLPMISVQILLLNLIYDISCAAIPWDNVDSEYLKKPRKWDASSIGGFMIYIGPTSSVFDITTYLLMFFVICPAVLGGSYAALDGAGKDHFAALFQTGWFVESMWTQMLVIHVIRTAKIPFVQSRASFPVFVLTFAGIGLLTAIPFTPAAGFLGLTPLPAMYFPWLFATVILYMMLAQLMKKVYIRKYGELH